MPVCIRHDLDAVPAERRAAVASPVTASAANRGSGQQRLTAIGAIRAAYCDAVNLGGYLGAR
jgi:hypothetical protein